MAKSRRRSNAKRQTQLEALGVPTPISALRLLVNNPPPARWEFCVEADLAPAAGETVIPGSAVALVSFQGSGDMNYSLYQAGATWKTGKQTSISQPTRVRIRASYQYTAESPSYNFTNGACP